ncbi:MAG: glycine dehydrogenase (aminomethyl-transferring) [Elusimicrobia bacterium GWF2_52_66]|nr:MAG: glycine dehydrogenase (aminomethyl-transferring) [Elusimicrobia bacterium GWA2_51_34]OGR84787.1 MAG: glycine dehydrogenase (aminomethyl-transferring) [Elusimicrobia bacterium GWF2_52_66]HAF95301.1 aminomethyl-transferring glycine dehydrogenase subunit GcvPB [Elusimicrobiota bacterium]HCE96927.1 aminomethyl-transferring glycine dehydrogenase subunit GcvPB [Elusimicrobiota bacterium]
MEDITTLDNRLSIEKSSPGRRALKFKGRLKHSAPPIPENLRRKTAPRLAELSEFDVVRHFTRLSKINFSLDSHFYPLGSCTMKYNPRVNEDIAALDGFTGLHPMAPDEAAQGTLECLYNLQTLLCELCGMEAITLQPAAGAHGEFAGLMAAKAYFAHKNQKDRVEVIVPDSAHGTNPASAAMLGFSSINIDSGPDGRVDLEVLKRHLGPKTAVVMLTIPNTLGIFESGIETISKMVHEAGALVYMDGANFNAMIGMIKPGELGVDIMHLNMHKTFSTPHGGGGPGAGAIAVKKYLDAYLPVPVIKKEGNRYCADFNRPLSIGKVKAFFGNTGVLLKAYAYLLMHSPRELGEISENAIINANYAKALLKDYYPSHSKDHCMHECVLAPSPEMMAKEITTLDVAKRLLDYGFHAPTIYFPHIAHEAIMIEPTETETRETVEEFASAMKKISAEALNNPQKLKDAPQTMPVKRLDEVQAARQPNLRW